MDFTSTYQHASWSCISFSPGSTFIAYVGEPKQNGVFVRVTGTLQVVRSWELPEPVNALEWSKDGLFLLASSYTDTYAARKSLSYVLPLDPDATVTDGSDDNRGWVACLDAGLQGLEKAMWVPVWRIPAVLQLAHYNSDAMIYSLADQTFTSVPSIVVPHVYANAKWPDHFGVVQRSGEHDYFVLYSPQSKEAPTMDDPVQYDRKRTIKLHTTAVHGAAWSPDSNYLVVYDDCLEYRACIYTLGGTLLATCSLSPDTEEALIKTGVESAQAQSTLAKLENDTPRPGGARRVAVRAARIPKTQQFKSSLSSSLRRSAATSTTTRVASGGLGIRCVAWQPSSLFLALGGYDEIVRILSGDDWSFSCVLNVTQANFASSQHDKANTIVWQEPQRWPREGIVPMDQCQLPVELPIKKPTDDVLCDGIAWMEWSRDGNVLAVRNECTPTVVALYDFTPMLERKHFCPKQLGLIVCATPITCTAWRPGSPCSLAVANGSQAIYIWSLTKSEMGAEQSAEAIAIPNEDFAALHFCWSHDGQSLLLADKRAFCCAVFAPSGQEDVM
ncbi:hypothetical protein MVES1_000518 [Malassezia vespertilionis]|uniref:uncharacterized protein n=1 Tax=Malassezia vespertilionis TaxID=2020962 RepID=UPI0024B0C27A|nr:uncharacterized protein MVES1_000518 [Malassezia vespertilionis]WFD05191.1 hypothetical protein MVES1_000518 [Malassezia vespertilionis]